MPLTEQELRGIAAEARIAIADDELAALTADLNQVLRQLEVIKSFDLDGVPLTFNPLPGLSNAMREDVAAASLPQQVALANAGATEDGQFKVPPILAEGGGEA